MDNFAPKTSAQEYISTRLELEHWKRMFNELKTLHEEAINALNTFQIAHKSFQSTSDENCKVMKQMIAVQKETIQKQKQMIESQAKEIEILRKSITFKSLN